jgi:carbonic anhydrase
VELFLSSKQTTFSIFFCLFVLIFERALKIERMSEESESTGMSMCTRGTEQSPINIETGKTLKCSELCDLIFYYKSTKANMVNTGTELVGSVDIGSQVNWKSNLYELDKWSICLPAAHTIDKFSYPMELLLYHKNRSSGEVLILSVFLDVNDAMSTSNLFFDSMLSMLPTKPGQQVHVDTDDDWNMYRALPETKSFYFYMGSLLKSPCTEKVVWIVMESPVNCSTTFYEKLKALLPSTGTGRAIQPLGKRRVSYNPNLGDKGKYNYGDRMRCYSDKEFNSACTSLVGTPIQGGNQSNSDNKSIVIAFWLSISIILALFCLWLWQQGTFQFVFSKIKSWIAPSE